MSSMDVIGRPRRRGARAHPTFGRRGERAPFAVFFTGLSSDSLGNYGLVGGHAAIGFSALDRQGNPLTPDAVKWSASQNPADAATFGAGASPTDFSAADGFFGFLHVTKDVVDDPDMGPITITRSFPVRRAPGAFGAIANQSRTKDSGVQTHVFGAATGTGLTWTYTLVEAPAGVTLNGATRTLSFDTNAMSAQGGATFTVRATDQYGRFIERSATITINLRAQATAANGLGPYSWTVDVTSVSVNAAADFTANGNTLTFAASGLPAGVTMAANGTMSGTPTAASSGTISITATDEYGRQTTSTTSHATALRPQATGGADLDLSFVQGTPTVSQNLLANWNTNGNTLTLVGVSPALPPGLSVSSSGVLTRTGALSIRDDATYTLTMRDAYNRQTSDTFTLQITAFVADPAVITILLVEDQDANGDVLLSYTIDKNDAAVAAVIYDASLPVPGPEDFLGGGDPAYQNLGTVSLVTSGGALPFDVTASFDGMVRIALLPTDGNGGDIAVSPAFTLDTVPPEIASLSPADGAVNVAASQNLVMTFTEAMKREGTVDLRAVAGALIESFDLATEGTWSAGDTVWTGNPAVDFPFGGALCVRWSGLEDVKGNPLPANSGDTLWNFGVIAAPTELVLLTQAVSDATSTPNKDFTVNGTAGETVVFVVNFGGGAPVLNSVTIDPGGPNQTTAVIRTQGAEANAMAALADVVWPASGSLTVRCNFSISLGIVGFTAISAGSRTHQTSNTAQSASVATPEVHAQTANATVGQAAILSATISSSGADAEPLAGVNAVVGGMITLAATRRAHVMKADSVAGGAPQTFSMRWPTLGFQASRGVLGIYG